MTFFALLKLADLSSTGPTKKKLDEKEAEHEKEKEKDAAGLKPASLSLRYNIEVHLPATRDIDVYNAKFYRTQSSLAAERVQTH